MKYPLPILPPRGQGLPILSPLGEIRKGVVSLKPVTFILKLYIATGAFFRKVKAYHFFSRLGN